MSYQDSTAVDLPLAPRPEPEDRPITLAGGRRFGRYVLLHRLAVGGTAEVFVARTQGSTGFERLVALKRILPTLEEDAEFVRMFVDEARVAGRLNHPNIVSVYELGEVDGTHFIAMELVRGKSMYQLMERARLRGQRLSPALVAFVASQVCEALDYAHRKCDRHGEPMRVVHRDLTPQNLLITYDGQLKVIDFGLARWAARARHTSVNVLKGTFAYMSPEQATGGEVDHRSDIFSLGACMYEMLTAQRLFEGDNHLRSLHNVCCSDIAAPSRFVSDLPTDLERIVMRALRRDPSERYRSASQMHRDLMSFLAKDKVRFSSTSLASTMESLFERDMGKERRRYEIYRERSTASDARDTRPASGPGSAPLMGEATIPDASFRHGETEEGADDAPSLGTLAVLAGPTYIDVREGGGLPVPRVEEPLELVPPPAPAALAVGASASRHTDRVEARELDELSSGSMAAVKRRTSRKARASSAPPPPKRSRMTSGIDGPTLVLSPVRAMARNRRWSLYVAAVAAIVGIVLGVVAGLHSRPAAMRVVTGPQAGARVFLDGRDVGETPLLLQEVSPGAHRVDVLAAGYRKAGRTVQLEPGSTAILELALERAPERRLVPD